MDVEPARLHAGAIDLFLVNTGHLTSRTILRTHNPAASYTHFNYAVILTYTSNL